MRHQVCIIVSQRSVTNLMRTKLLQSCGAMWRKTFFLRSLKKGVKLLITHYVQMIYSFPAPLGTRVNKAVAKNALNYWGHICLREKLRDAFVTVVEKFVK